MQQGIQDTSRGGAYHNKKFRDAATARDLNISYDKRIGWSITQPTDALCEFILDQGWTDIQMNRIEWSFTPRGAGSGNAAGGETGKAPTTTETATTANMFAPAAATASGPPKQSIFCAWIVVGRWFSNKESRERKPPAFLM